MNGSAFQVTRRENLNGIAKLSCPTTSLFIETRLTYTISDAGLIFVSFIIKSCCKIGVSFLLRCLKLQVEVLRLLDFKRSAIELIEAGKHGRTALEASVIVFFDG